MRKRHEPSDNVRVVPIFRKKADIAKLGRAVIAIAEMAAKEDNDEKIA